MSTLTEITEDDELIHDIDQMIATLKLRRAAIVARRPDPVNRQPWDGKITDDNGRVWDFDNYARAVKKSKKKGDCNDPNKIS